VAERTPPISLTPSKTIAQRTPVDEGCPDQNGLLPSGQARRKGRHYSNAHIENTHVLSAGILEKRFRKHIRPSILQFVVGSSSIGDGVAKNRNTRCGRRRQHVYPIDVVPVISRDSACEIGRRRRVPAMMYDVVRDPGCPVTVVEVLAIIDRDRHIHPRREMNAIGSEVTATPGSMVTSTLPANRSSLLRIR